MTADRLRAGEASCPEGSSFAEALGAEPDFTIRRAVERLREGLFDPAAVRWLTAREDRLKTKAEQGFSALEEGRAPHLGVVGAYGQGKSHSLIYIQNLALEKDFVTSFINLDPREIPFNNFRAVYRALLKNIQFPGSNGSFPSQWRQWAQQQKKSQDQAGINGFDLLPPRMPYFFKALLAAMAQNNRPLSEKEKRSKTHAAFRPKEFPLLLSRALEGEVVPFARLRNVFKYRQVELEKSIPMSLRGSEPFFLMLEALSILFRRMGYRGWALLFDEGESIVQANVFARSKSYSHLHRLLAPENSEPSFLYPVVAFTEDFFERVAQEDYDQVRMRGELSIPYFDRNYAETWRNLNLYRLDDLSRAEWEELARKLVCLHAKAYRWQPEQAIVFQEMANRLDVMRGQETRLKLKALVDCLDVKHQEHVLQ